MKIDKKVLHTVIDAHANQYASNTAIETEQGRIDYKGLAANSGHLSQVFSGMGLVKEEVIATYLPSCINYVCSLLGAMKAGLITMPMEMNYPQNRLLRQLQRAVPRLIVTEKEYLPSLQELLADLPDPPTVLILSRSALNPKIYRNTGQGWTAQKEHLDLLSPKEAVNGDDSAYLLYTSGSTGTPKGIEGVHKGLSHFVHWQQKEFALDSTIKVSQLAPVSFDVSLRDIFLPLLCGGTLCIPSQETKASPSKLFKWLIDNKISLMHTVPTMFRALTEELARKKNKDTYLSHIFLAGEALYGKDILDWFSQAGEATELVNLYGPSETTLAKLFHRVDPKTIISPAAVVPLGQPISNTAVMVISNNTLCNPGAVGEIYIKTPFRSKGYYKDPELTEKKFIQHPLHNDSIDIVFKTGDFGKYDDQDKIHFVGRTDGQVKIRGNRVELQEVEHALRSHPLSGPLVVRAIDQDTGEKVLVCHFEQREGLTEELLRTHIGSLLPSYMCPAHYVHMEVLPLNLNGKIDRRALPDPETLLYEHKAYRAPSTKIEILLSEIWQDVLGLKKVGTSHSFLQLGGHSLAATRTVAQIYRRSGVQLGLKEFFDHPTIAELATYLKTRTSSEYQPIQIGQRPDLIPLSHAQERLWFLDKLQGSSNYHMPTVLKLQGKVDRKILETALKGIIQRHEVLRTVYREVDGVANQEVMPSNRWQMKYRDLSMTGSDTPPQKLIENEVSRPFNLEADYMLRSQLVKIAADTYILIVVMHHIASDGWSLPIIVQELMEIYRAQKEERKMNLPALPIQYADYAIWQRKHLSDELMEEELSYWEKQLATSVPLNFPTDHPRQAAQSIRGAHLEYSLEASVVDKLKQLSKKEEATLYMTLLGAFNILLNRYTGQEDICVGSPIANRSRLEVEPLIGFFVNTLTLRNNVENDMSFRTLLAQIKNTTLEAYQHQQVPFEKVVDRVVKERDMSRTPLFQVFLVLQNNDKTNALDFGDIAISNHPYGYEYSQFDLSFHMSETENGIDLTIEYCRDLFTSETIDRIFTHYKTLLSEVVNEPDIAIGQLAMLPKEQETALLGPFNESDVPFPEEKTLVDLFKESKDRHLDNTAISYNGAELTYKELDDLSDRLAFHLRDTFSLEPDDMVGIMLERSHWAIVSILGVLKAGAAYVPIAPEYPEERKLFILKDTAVKALIIDSNSLFEVTDWNLPLVVADIQITEFEKPISKRLLDVIQPDHLAYIIYTSGSTGKPKGVMISHKNLVNYLCDAKRRYGKDDQPLSFPLFTSLSFDLTQTSMLLTFLTGGQLWITQSEHEEVLNTLPPAVNAIKLTPSHALFFAAEVPNKNIKIAIVGGEPLESKHVQKLRSVNPGMNIFNEYGPTEATIGCSVSQVIENEKITIGGPISNTKLFVLDNVGQLTPIGVPGELCIAGAGLARGYLKRPELTKEKFVTNPFGEGNLYRTGDRVRRLLDGNLEYLGRLDDQVKIRGYRIELGEIGQALENIPQIEQGVVIARQKGSENTQLIGYAVPKEALEKKEIIRILKKTLPEYMVPNIWCFLDSLPLNTNGKLDKKALPAPEATSLSSVEYQAPSNELEEKLVGIWQEFLKIEKIGIHDNFFELGGHSLLATRIVSAVRKNMAVEILIKDIFANPTVRELANLLESGQRGISLPAIEKEDRPHLIPLSYAQERLWFLDKLRGSTNYHIPTILTLTGKVRTDILEATLRGIIARHEILRTVYREVDGAAYQEVITADQWEMEYRDFSETNDTSEFQELIEKEVKRPFDLGTDFMLRSQLFTMGEEHYVLMVVMHHIASDGWSLPIIVTELMEIYRSKIEERPVNLPPLQIQYADYALWQRKHLTEAILEKEISYWKKQLMGAVPLDFPTDYPRGTEQSIRGGHLDFTLAASVVQKLKKLSEAEGATLYMTLLGTLNILLNRYTGQEDICIGSPIANRTRSEIEPLIGFFVNTLTLRCKLNNDQSFRMFMGEVKNTTLGAYENQLVPFEKVVDHVVRERDMSKTPLVQVSLTLQNQENTETLDFGEIALSNYDFGYETSKLDLSLYMSETEAGMSVTIEYCSDLFTKETINRLFAHYATLLSAVSNEPDLPIKELRMLSNEEEVYLLESLNKSRTGFQSDINILQLFKKQVDQHPDTIAIFHDNTELTYQELDILSDRLAQYLKNTYALEPDDLVGMMLERSHWAIVAILGILKAGAAYVPIDSEYPEERKLFIVNDTAIKALIIDSNSFFEVTDWNVPVVAIDIQLDDLEKEISAYELTLVQPAHLAYVIYTSGSTGTPKGTMIEHKGLASIVQNQIEIFGVTDSSNVLQFASLGFDASCSEIFTTLLAGGRLVIPKKEELLSIERFIDILKTQHIDIVTLPPSYQILLGDNTCNLKTIISAGEALNIPVVKSFQEKGIKIINFYGPTENSVGTTMSEDPIREDNKATIGKPINNVQVYILDTHTNLVPLGISGELCIAGGQLARGYLKLPELTREKFIPNPFSSDPNSKLYRTGDKARWLPDGNIEFLGRLDHQIKLNGHRIELGEVEQSIISNRNIEQAIVSLHKKANGNTSLVAYYQKRKSVKLRPSLAEYFVYDDLAYHALTTDDKRNGYYKRVFKKYLNGKVVLDIGTGPEAILARFCIEAGAKKVYAVEISKEVYLKAKQRVKELGLAEKIILINNDITKVELPEKVDYCVSEIVGPIGGSEGAAKLINLSRKLLKDPSNMFPKRALTKIAGAHFPDHQHDFSFDELGKHYVEKIFDEMGYKFDLRLCVEDFPLENVITNHQRFEDLDFTAPLRLEENHDIQLEFDRDTTVTGFLVWLNLYVDDNEIIDTLSEKYSWLPIYLPVFEKELNVQKGDYISATISRVLSDNDLNPDFMITGKLVRKDENDVPFSLKSANHERRYRHTDFYEKLFQNDTLRLLPKEDTVPNKLREYVKARLPEYMVPSQWMEVSDFALTSNGKIDRKQLPSPEVSSSLSKKHTPPSNDMEKKLCQICEELLGAERIGIDDDFFELGGHSLLATRLVSVISQELSVQLLIKDIFDWPTVRQLADLIASGQRKKNQLNLITAEHPRPDRIPLSYAQERLWFIDRQLEGSTQYNISGALDLSGKLNVDLIANAFRAIINRHEVLRTVFLEDNGTAYQHILPIDQWELHFTDAQKDSPSEIDTRIASEAMATFDLAKDHMLKAHLIRRSQKEYTLVVIMHHIASDGWSFPILVREFVALYKAFDEATAPNLPDLPVQYADYAIWQRKYLSEGRLEKELAYWQGQLANVPPLELPTDFPRPSVQSTKGGSSVFMLSQELALQLKELSQKEGSTLFMTLLASFNVLLKRYTRQEDICVGSPIANRTNVEIEPLVGFFVNTLALRNQLDGTLSFKMFLEQVRKNTLDAYEHQHAPFEKVVDLVAQERDMSRNPLFQVIFVLQNNEAAEEITLNKLKVTTKGVFNETSKFDLAFYHTEIEDGIEVNIEYCSALFKPDTIKRIFEHYRHLLTAIVKNPSMPIAKLDMLTIGEKEKILGDFNDTEYAYPRDKTVVDLFDEQRRRNPSKIALVTDHVQLSYRELGQRSNQLARYLKKQGVTTETLVGICMDRSLDTIIGILGILKAGGAYVPIDPTYPKERVAYMLTDAQLKIVLVQSDYTQLFEDTHGLRILAMDSLQESIEKESSRRLTVDLSADNLAYVNYTSGSTGKPKGVLIEHRAIARLIFNENLSFLGKKSVLYQYAPVTFDAATFEIWGALLKGGKLVMSSAKKKSLEEIAEDLHTNSVNTLWLTAGLFHTAVENHLPLFEKLDYILAGGDSIATSKVQKLLEHFPGLTFINGYGPTEATTFSLINPIAGVDALDLSHNNIGKPISNTKAYILDTDGKICPIGVPGELCISGDGLARGYLDRSDLTMEKFVVNPYSKNTRLYRTGDLARWFPDGSVEFLGRLDDQVKIRGYRIELGEVRHAVLQLPEVGQSAVLARETGEFSKELVCYFVPERAALKEQEKQLSLKLIENWRFIYDDEYGSSEASDTEFDVTGWMDSFTGEPIPEEQMAEWLDDISRFILSEKPQNVLEIGCGTGLVYHRLVPHIKSYTGTDISQVTIDTLQSVVAKGQKQYPKTSLLLSSAHEITTLPKQPIDTIILNSVIQYFPGEGYLIDVLQQSISALDGKGRIIIGDVRNNELLHLFQGRLYLDKLSQEQTKNTFLWNLEKEVVNDKELCISPSFFYGLATRFPEISHIDIEWKQGRFHNEMSLYRYNVIVHVGEEKERVDPEWVSWNDFKNTEEIPQMLETLETLAIKEVPNPRLWRENSIKEGIGRTDITTTTQLAEHLASGTDRKQLEEIELLLTNLRNKGVSVRQLINGDSLKMNLLLEKTPSNGFITNLYEPVPQMNLGTPVNFPTFYEAALNIQNGMKETLSTLLPDYMVPTKYFPIPVIPMTANGKVDKKALSDSNTQQLLTTPYKSPDTALEQTLVDLWSKLLQVEQVGIHDNFFELGGHSLLATRVVSAVRKNVAVEILIKDIFTSPTVKELADLIESGQRGVSLSKITKEDRPDLIPLSYAQERLWFLYRLQGGSNYHMPTVLKLQGKVERDILEATFRGIIERHEVLRTVYKEADGSPYQEVVAPDRWGMEYIDFSDTGDKIPLREFIENEVGRSFNLETDYMLRSQLIRTGEEDYVLIVVMHHIASDGWSMPIIVNELMEIYRAYQQQREIALPPLPIQYADYAIWQRRYLSGGILEQELAYWEKQLAGAVPLDFPTDYPRAAEQSIRGGRLNFTLKAALVKKLKQLSKEEGATLYMTLLAACNILLNRYTGQEDICVGGAIANRTRSEIEPLIGFFVNTLTLRNKLDSRRSFRTFLAQVKNSTLDAYQYQQVPFEKVVDHVVKERDMSRTPLFQVLLVLLNNEKSETLDFGDIELSNYDFGYETSKFDLTFYLTEIADDIEVNIEYCSDLFKPDTITRIFEHYEQLFEAIVAAPSMPIAKLDMLTTGEKEKILGDFNDTDYAYPRNKTVVDLFDEQHRRNPSKIALAIDNDQLSYKELSQKSNQLAHYLKKQGVTTETLVGICMDRSLDTIIGILGILKAGGAYVPFDPTYPKERIGYMLTDAQLKIVLVQSDYTQLFEETQGLNILAVDALQASIEKEPKRQLSIDLSSDNLAYVNYTSGSTGKPKGVLIEHRAIARLIFNESLAFLGKQSILYQYAPVTFDLATFEIWGALLKGGKLVLPSAQKKSLEEITADLHSQNVNTLWLTAGLFHTAVENHLPLFEKLDYILAGGDSIGTLKVQKLLQHFPDLTFINGYGPTEATTFAVVNPITDAREIDLSHDIIGKPISNTRVYVLDNDGKLCPIGIAGELCISGDGLARGYLDRSDLTIEKFVANPFSKNTRLYKTGDLAKWLPDGNIEFLGRLDNQVKIRGYRVELGEVLHTVHQLPAVSQSTILARETGELSKELVCYFVPERAALKEQEKQLALKLIENWRYIYDDEYATSTRSDTEFDVTGWMDSFTGEPIPEEQMAEWQDDISRFILGEKPRNVLEIGCGTGLVYHRLVPHIETYTGTDISQVTIEALQKVVAKGEKEYPKTSLFLNTAHEISALPHQPLDTIILNSVIQYFPGEGYLTDVLQQSIAALNGKGRIILGDVRNNELLHLFHSRLYLDKLSKEQTKRTFLWNLEKEVLNDKELCVAPGFFYDLATSFSEISHVEIEWKQGWFQNEMSLYRYNVILHIGGQKERVVPEWISWGNLKNPQEISKMLPLVETLAIKDVPNPRLWRETKIKQAIDRKDITSTTLLKEYITGASDNKELEELELLLRDLRNKGVSVRQLVNGDSLKMNLLFEKTPNDGFITNSYDPVLQMNLGVPTNFPTFYEASLNIQNGMKQDLNGLLPDYMVPTKYFPIPVIPMTANGKVDKKALSDSNALQLLTTQYKSPDTILEQKLVDLWAKLLQVERVGIHDNFFELGGHSMLAVSVVHHIKKELEIHLSVRSIFQFTTVHDLAAYLEVIDQVSVPNEDEFEDIHI